MKLKLNPKFKPCPQEEDDELYPNGIFVFNITKMLNYIAKNSDQFLIEQADVISIRTGHANSLNEKTIQEANLMNPIILAEIAPQKFNVIDGNHRLERAYRENISKIPAYRITPKDHLQFLTTEIGYKAYVDYWNEKLYQRE